MYLLRFVIMSSVLFKKFDYLIATSHTDELVLYLLLKRGFELSVKQILIKGTAYPVPTELGVYIFEFSECIHEVFNFLLALIL